MFLFIGGIQPRTVTMERLPQCCPHCGHAEIRRRRIDQYLALFFIPLIRVKKGEPFLDCGRCHSVLAEGAGRADTGEGDMKCRSCGRPFLKPDFAYCPYCGEKR